LGYIEVSYDANGKIVSYQGAPIHMTNTTNVNSQLEAQVQQWAAPFAAYANTTVVGTTSMDLNQSTCHSQECTLGDLVADATLWYRKNTSNFVDAAIVSSDRLQASIHAGNITVADVLAAFPLEDTVADVRLTAAQLWMSFEGIVSGVNQWNGAKVTSFAQVSQNIQITYNPNNAAGSRLISLSINGKLLQSNDNGTSYGIVTWDSLARGGNNFWPPQSGYSILDTQEEVLVYYLGQFNPVNTTLDGRIAVTSQKSPTVYGHNASPKGIKLSNILFYNLVCIAIAILVS
jgi:2',3'-cyclic-nucleotide 2'-phosphodiesterase (5'-nucleotidase family)